MVGQNIGKYRVLDRIGRGGMGTVYRAIDETLHREVAIKVLNAELNDPEVAKRFRAEAITVARLSHPGIATIYELFQHDGQWLMVMEFVRGETLERLVDRMGALSPQRTAELCMQTLAALAHAHSMGVVHRDLKPANIMITETGAIKVMDFGIARVAGTEHLTSAGFMMGTPAYMAPEQVMGKEIDARADLYAMGVVFYRLTTGKLPFKGDTPFAMAQSQVNDPPTPLGVFRADLPPWVEQVVVRALAKSPEERFQSAIEFHESFARCLAGLPMVTLYHSSAPTELLMTPSRAMPTGSLQQPLGAVVPPLTGSIAEGTRTQPTAPQSFPELEPTVLSPTPMAVRVPTASNPVVVSSAIAAPAAVPAPVTSPEPPTVDVTSDAGHGSRVVAPTKQTKKQTSIGLGAVAAVVLVVGVSAVWWLMSRGPAMPSVAEAPVPQPVEGASVEPPADTLPATPVVAAPVSPTPGAAASGAGSGSPTAAAADLRASAAPAVRSAGAGTAATTAAPDAGRGAAPVDDTALTYPEGKLLIVNGRKTDDEDVTISFGNGQVALLAKRSGNAIAAMPYRSTLRATYARARDPRWDAALSGPPQNLDVGGMLRTSKHWLVLQASDAYLILRLDDSNWRNVLETVTARTNISVDRPVSNDKP